MAATYERIDRRAVPEWQVRCDDAACPRPIDMVVGSMAHGHNLAAKHNREHHADQPDPDAPPSYDVSAAARAYLDACRTVRSVRGMSGDAISQAAAAVTAAEEVWYALTGLTGRAALDAAEHAATHQTTAYATPF